MTTTPLTMAEYEEAVANGDTICQCGYRKSQHGPNHPAPDSHNPSQCNNRRFVRSGSFNEAVLLHREHVEPTLFEGEGAA